MIDEDGALDAHGLQDSRIHAGQVYPMTLAGQWLLGAVHSTIRGESLR